MWSLSYKASTRPGCRVADLSDLPSFDSVEWLVHSALGWKESEAPGIDQVLEDYGVRFEDVRSTFDRHIGEITDEKRELAWLMFVSGVVHTLIWRKMVDDLGGFDAVPD